ncbi:uncharacterized protein IWZ02DRAFT_49366 [Phyllosticta citriasiana]|uniref:uncharacterized protein n=1 Tax=Phyllosticta citriasiana TaxID=595635 RepID=UPI0030FD7757
MTTLALFPASRQTPSSSAHVWPRRSLATTSHHHDPSSPQKPASIRLPPKQLPTSAPSQNHVLCACMHSNPRATCTLRSPVPRAVTGEPIELAVHQLPPPPPAGQAPEPTSRAQRGARGHVRPCLLRLHPALWAPVPASCCSCVALVPRPCPAIARPSMSRAPLAARAGGAGGGSGVQ